VPFMLPIKLSGCSSKGTSFATGLPRLVMITYMRGRCTSSITWRHLALNSPAGFMTVVIPPLGTRYNSNEWIYTRKWSACAGLARSAR
jgi:hypothetical protein